MMRFLVAESETPAHREERRRSTGQSSGETYRETLKELEPDADCVRITPSDEGASPPLPGEIASFDAVFLTGSPLHLYRDMPETRRQVEFMRAVFASGTPSFGSCAGLQVATVAAGGTVKPNTNGHEAAFARRITPTAAGRDHPLLAGRPPSFDAPSIHTDEVEHLPDGGLCLARNEVTAVQAAEIQYGPGTFWGVQYHPELSLAEIGAALRRQAADLVREGFAPDRETLEDHAALIEALDREPSRRDLAWRLGLDDEVTQPDRRRSELRNFLQALVRPTRSARGRA